MVLDGAGSQSHNINRHEPFEKINDLGFSLEFGPESGERSREDVKTTIPWDGSERENGCLAIYWGSFFLGFIKKICVRLEQPQTAVSDVLRETKRPSKSPLLRPSSLLLIVAPS